MSFLHSEFLYVVLPLLFILFGFILTQKQSYEHHFSDEVMQKLRVTSNTLTLQARNALFFISAILMVIAMSGPVIDNGTIEVKAKSADIMIALDISDSMLAEDTYPNRLKRAKQKAMEFIELSKTQRIGVVAFAKNSYLVSPLSFDANAVNFLLSKLSTDSITEKGTNFLSLLETVDDKVKNKTQRYLFILSDGGDEGDFSKEIAYAKEHNIVVFVLGIGTKKGAPIKLESGSFVKYKGKIIISKLNDSIGSLATKSGGVYIESVNSDEDIKRMHKEIESRAKQKELKSQTIQNFVPLFYYPLGLSLLILLIATSSMSKRKHVEVPSAFIVALLFSFTPRAEAGLLDFQLIDEAKEAYTKGEYEKAQNLYKKLSLENKDATLLYNRANSFYKERNYKEAIKNYKKSYFKTPEENAKKYANLGNSYVKEGAKDALKNAKESYEKSLALKEDSDVRDNLNAVIEAMKKQQQKKQKQQDKQNKQNQKKKDEKKKQSQDKNKQQKEKNQQQKQDDSKKDGSKQEEQEQKQPQDKSKQNQKDKDSKNSKQKEQEKQKKEQSQSKKEQEKKSKKLEELKSKKGDASKEQKIPQAKKMSDEEQAKWLKTLNKKQGTYLYMLNKQQTKQEMKDEKPW